MVQLVYRLAILALFISGPSYAAKILLVTDQATQAKAKEIKMDLETMAPFSMLEDFSVVIRTIPKNFIQCKRPYNEKSKEVLPKSCAKITESSTKTVGNGRSVVQVKAATPERLLVCDTKPLQELSGSEGADRTIFVKEGDESGGSFSDGSITVTTGTSGKGAVHELLHSFGFADEYGYYTQCEADIYCPERLKKSHPNLVVLKDEGPYASDANARAKHFAQIPWAKLIKPETAITTEGQLGTPMTVQRTEVGLFEVAVCEKATIKVKSFRPGSKATIMERLESSYIPDTYWLKISESLNSKFKPQYKKYETALQNSEYNVIK